VVGIIFVKLKLFIRQAFIMNVEENVINLYVDDLRDCPYGFTVARTFEEAVFSN
jgi:hypothetical protein